MNIINYKSLAKNNLRRKALLIAEAGYKAINIEKVIGERLEVKEEILSVKTINESIKINLNDFKNIYLIGVGKGSALASIGLAKILGKRLTQGISLDVQPSEVRLPKIERMKSLAGDHPLPSARNVKATGEIMKLLKKAGKDDLVITFICGGGSALLCGDGNELKYSQTVFKDLTKAGADIFELNTVRKHLSAVKGGGLAKIAYPAIVVSLIVSDVLENDLSMIASGPTALDKTTKKDAFRILKNYQLPITNYQLRETLKGKKYFQNVQNILFASNKDAIRAMDKKAKELGFKANINSLKFKGEAKNAFNKMVRGKWNKNVILAGGETTVKLKAESKKYKVLGKGGRNQEAVLGGLRYLNTKKLEGKNILFISFASDGHDNSGAGGAIGDALTLGKAKKLGLDIQNYLERHDSFNFFRKTGDLVYVRKNSFNVADLMVVVRK